MSVGRSAGLALAGSALLHLRNLTSVGILTRHGFVEYRCDHWHTATAAGAGFCAGFDITDGFASSVFYNLRNGAFADIVAGALAHH